jgi:hypothetical protein
LNGATGASADDPESDWAGSKAAKKEKPKP